MVEFVNRVVTGFVSLGVILAVLGSLRREPRRRDLTRLSLGLVAGVIGQIVLGRFTVTFELRPGFVMAHFLLSMVLLANAVVLHDRAGQDVGGVATRTWGADRDLKGLGSLLVATAGLVLFLGTVVTSARIPRRRREGRAPSVRPARRGPPPRGSRGPVPRPHPGRALAVAIGRCPRQRPPPGRGGAGRVGGPGRASATSSTSTASRSSWWAFTSLARPRCGSPPSASGWPSRRRL